MKKSFLRGGSARVLSWTVVTTNSRNTISRAVRLNANVFLYFSSFFFFPTAWIQLQGQRKGAKNKRCDDIMYRGSYLSGDHVNSQAVPRLNRDNASRTKATENAHAIPRWAMCAAVERKRVHVLSLCLFSNDRFRERPRRCSPSSLRPFYIDLMFRCIEPTNPFSSHN